MQRTITSIVVFLLLFGVPRAVHAADPYVVMLSSAHDATADTSSRPSHSYEYHRRTVGLEIVSGLALGLVGQGIVAGTGTFVGIATGNSGHDFFPDESWTYPLIGEVLVGPVIMASAIDLIGRKRDDIGRWWFAYTGSLVGVTATSACFTASIMRRSNPLFAACFVSIPVNVGLGVLLYNAASPNWGKFERAQVLPQVSLIERGAIIGLNARF